MSNRTLYFVLIACIAASGALIMLAEIVFLLVSSGDYAT